MQIIARANMRQCNETTPGEEAGQGDQGQHPHHHARQA